MNIKTDLVAELQRGNESAAPMQVTSGATSDLQNATRLARHMVEQCGMSDLLGGCCHLLMLALACLLWAWSHRQHLRMLLLAPKQHSCCIECLSGAQLLLLSMHMSCPSGAAWWHVRLQVDKVQVLKQGHANADPLHPVSAGLLYSAHDH